MRLAFYDLDGTLVSSNVVTLYAWYARNHPSRLTAAEKLARLLAGVPVWIACELYSRRRFNEVFYREYRGFRQDWLLAQADALFSTVLRGAIYPGAEALVAADREAGYRTVLVTGSLDFALGPLVRHFGFDELIANRLVFRDGGATGEMAPPVIAEQEKVAAMRRLLGALGADPRQSKAYSDSISDLPMLEAVGLPAAANPDRRLRRAALARGWPVLDLRRG